VDLQAVLGETFWEDFHDAMVISLVANPDREVIRKANQTTWPHKAWLHFFFKPYIQNVVQEDVRKYR
jgi:hypothetical protein